MLRVPRFRKSCPTACHAMDQICFLSNLKKNPFPRPGLLTSEPPRPPNRRVVLSFPAVKKHTWSCSTLTQINFLQKMEKMGKKMENREKMEKGEKNEENSSAMRWHTKLTHSLPHSRTTFDVLCCRIKCPLLMSMIFSSLRTSHFGTTVRRLLIQKWITFDTASFRMQMRDSIFIPWMIARCVAVPRNY